MDEKKIEICFFSTKRQKDNKTEFFVVIKEKQATMKKIVLTMMWLMASAVSMAQNEVGHWTLTPKVGLNLATLTDPDIYVGVDGEKMAYHLNPGIVVGAEAEYQLSSLVGLSAGLLYSQQGTRQKDISMFRDASVKLNYLNVPLTANIYFVRNVAVRLGVQAGWTVSSSEKAEVSDGDGHWTHLDEWYMAHRSFDLSVPLGLSWNVGRLQFDARYIIGLTNISKYGTVKQRNRVIQLTIGYRFE